MPDNFRLDEATGVSQLHTSVLKLAEKADKQSRQMLVLTWAMAALTFATTALAVVQVCIALK